MRQKVDYFQKKKSLKICIFRFFMAKIGRAMIEIITIIIYDYI